MENLFIFEMDSFSDVVIVKTYVFHPLCCEVFWPVHTGVVVIVSFVWNVEVDVWQVWEDVSNMLDKICEFIHGFELCLPRAKNGAGLEGWFPYASPQKSEDDELNN